MTECDKYDHIPEPYDVAFWHCKVCDIDLVFLTQERMEELVEKAWMYDDLNK